MGVQALVVREIPVEAVQPSQDNPRRFCDAPDIQRLAGSLAEHGLLQPIVVRPGPGPQVRYVLIAGERRLRAAQQLGWRTIQAVIYPLPGRRGHDVAAQALLLTLVENLQRQELSALEEAEGYAHLIALGLKRTQIAAGAGRSVSVVKNALRLLRLPEAVQALLRSGQLSASHARALCRYEGFDAVQVRLAQLAIAERWPSRALDTRRLPGAERLLTEGIIARPPLSQSPFATICRACPFGAFRSGYCLKPTHLAELQQTPANRAAPPPSTETVTATGEDWSTLAPSEAQWGPHTNETVTATDEDSSRLVPQPGESTATTISPPTEDTATKLATFRLHQDAIRAIEDLVAAGHAPTRHDLIEALVRREWHQRIISTNRLRQAAAAIKRSVVPEES